MIKNLIKIADKLDSIGLEKEADFLDSLIRKLASEPDIYEHKVKSGDTFSEVVEEYGNNYKSYQENLELNKRKNPNFDPENISPGQTIYVYIPPEAEGLYRPEKL